MIGFITLCIKTRHAGCWAVSSSASSGKDLSLLMLLLGKLARGCFRLSLSK